MDRMKIPLVVLILSLCGCTTGTESSLPATTNDDITVKITAPTETIVPPTDIPVTPTATPITFVIDSPEVIDIQEPQPSASVSNPLVVRGVADPTFEQNLSVRLVGLENTELGSMNFMIDADAGQRGSFSGNLEYVSGENQDALLQVYSLSAMDGSLEHLNSTLVKLIPQEELPASAHMDTEMIHIQSVKIIQVNNKLELQADGLVANLFTNRLRYKLCYGESNGSPDFVCGTTDNVMVSGMADIQSISMESVAPFTISASLPHGQWKTARLVVFCDSPANGEVMHAASQIIKNGP